MLNKSEKDFSPCTMIQPALAENLCKSQSERQYKKINEKINEKINGIRMDINRFINLFLFQISLFLLISEHVQP